MKGIIGHRRKGSWNPEYEAAMAVLDREQAIEIDLSGRLDLQGSMGPIESEYAKMIVPYAEPDEPEWAMDIMEVYLRGHGQPGVVALRHRRSGRTLRVFSARMADHLGRVFQQFPDDESNRGPSPREFGKGLRVAAKAVRRGRPSKNVKFSSRNGVRV